MGGIEGQECRMTAEQHDFTLMVFQKTKVLQQIRFSNTTLQKNVSII
ncbi:hypothetical protein KsCSTR_38580 [Candidatus Kuenenia stuttgartiensis]|uniref:Uncharacterized protein n=1 Tax=Kuenenia stuttgartiensis TaxID=174633 RepID=A0A6G7GVJ6_KUEST|nr:hypothetical protein KsCSTR_38580 [Candidatus Kuenenia stuttgartiensis]